MIDFDKATHTYSKNGVIYTSVSSAINKYKPIFYRKTMAEAIAKRDRVGPELILAQWQQKANMSCQWGNDVHSALENYIKNNIFPDDEKLAEIVNNFALWRSCKKGKLCPEDIIYSDEYKVAGKVDLPIKQRVYIDIYDYKTNEELTNENKYNKFFLRELSYLGYTKYTQYVIQLSIYALLYKLQGFKPRNLGILHIKNDGTIEEIPVPFMYQEALTIINDNN